jgi:hypothetical protein
MARTIMDQDLKSWEAFASTGPYGYAPHSRVVFHCTSDASERPRACKVEGDKSDVESLVAAAPQEKLRELLASAEPID